MSATSTTSRERPRHLDRDLLEVSDGQRGYYIQQALASSEEPLTVNEIGDLAKELDHRGPPKVNPRTYSYGSVYQHLKWMSERGGAEQLDDKRWQLTPELRDLLAANPRQAASELALAPDDKNGVSEVRMVDSKGRISLPKEFANATVMVEMVGESELRIRKAVVLPEASLPTIEDALPPLSDEDRDFFLQLIDNPPEPNAAFRKAAKHYKKWHGRNSD